MVRTIILLCKKGLFVDSKGLFDSEVTKKQLSTPQNAVRFLNCSWFIKDKCTSAIEKECKADHMTALVSDQLKCFQDAMSKAKTTNIDKNSELSVKDRLVLHRLFGAYFTANTQQIKEFKFKRENHDEYLGRYAELADEMIDEANGFMYVCAKDISDYGKFISLIKKLPAVTPCDHLQAI
jgi:hypothetical protein